MTSNNIIDRSFSAAAETNNFTTVKLGIVNFDRAREHLADSGPDMAEFGPGSGEKTPRVTDSIWPCLSNPIASAGTLRSLFPDGPHRRSKCRHIVGHRLGRRLTVRHDDGLPAIRTELTKNNVDPPSRELPRGPCLGTMVAHVMRLPLSQATNRHSNPAGTSGKPILDGYLWVRFATCLARLLPVPFLTTAAHDKELAPTPTRKVCLLVPDPLFLRRFVRLEGCPMPSQIPRNTPCRDVQLDIVPSCVCVCLRECVFALAAYPFTEHRSSNAAPP